jgi:predicted dinucleotide-binding enzyme
MRFGVLGSGMVGRALAAKLLALGHGVMIGTRDPDELLARPGPDARGRESFAEWRERNPEPDLGTFGEAAAAAEIVVNATAGDGSLDALAAAGADNLGGKILIDIANPLDYSQGMPPSLLVPSTDSLAEQIQRAFPQALVVKTLNTVTAAVMVDPGSVGGGDHDVFVSGDDQTSKDTVIELLRSFGWTRINDLGGLASARAVEMYLPLWVANMGVLGTPMFNVKLVRAEP